MSKKGENKKVKALNAPKSVQLNRKKNTWTVKTRAGAHKAKDSISIGIILRNYLNLASSMKEAKKILLEGQVKINGKIRKDNRLGIGLFDVISLEKQEKNYRVIFDKKRRIQIKKIEKETSEKISKIISKTITKKGIQITTNEGYNYINDKAKVNDSIIIDFKENKIKEVLPLQKGAFVYLTKGSHCSEKGTIEEIVNGTARRKKLIKIKQNEQKFETTIENLIVIGKEKEAIEDLKNI